MIKVSAVVEEIVAESEFALEGLHNGCLNFSAYAKCILPRVTAKTKKDVTLTSVITALSRLSSRSKIERPFLPDIGAHNMFTRSGLAEISYNKTPEVLKLIASIQAKAKFSNSQFFVVIVGLSEVSIVTSEELASEIVDLFSPVKPKLHLTNLASLSIQTHEEGIHTPNQFYAILRVLAFRRININEFITTHTELTFILAENDLKHAFNLLYDKFFLQSHEM